eukprot:tig00020780_g13752.t3
MQSRSNGVRTAAANLTSLERERRSKSAAPGRRAPARGEERSLFLLLVGSRRKEKAAADAKQGNGASGAGAVLGRVASGRPRPRSSLCLRPLGRRCGSERCAVAATAFRALSILVWALGDSERSAFDVGHGQGMLEAGTGLLLSPCCAQRARRRSAARQQYYLLFGS